MATLSLTFWHNELHIGPVEDVKDLFRRFEPRIKVRWHDHSFSVYCHYVGTCAKDKKVLSLLSFDKILNGWDVAVEAFYKAYKGDPSMSRVDAFYCSHPPSGCRFFIPFKKPIIAQFAVPFSFSMDYIKSPLLAKWMFEIRAMHSSPRNFMSVNNGHLVKLAPSELGFSLPWVPSLCRYTRHSYASKGVTKMKDGSILKNVKVVRMPWACPTVKALNTYSKYLRFHDHKVSKKGHFASIANDFAAVLYCPYTTSTMSFMEIYNMNVPIFMPSIKRASYTESAGQTRWFSWHPVIDAKHSTDKYVHYAPGIAVNKQRLLEWLKEVDYYNGNYPYISYWSSHAEIISLLVNASPESLTATSKKLADHNAKRLEQVKHIWEGVLHGIRSKA